MPTPPPNYAQYPRQAPQGAGDLCPQCGQYAAKKVQYTWWGGLVGPALLKMSRCGACKFEFNRSTGKSVKNAVLVITIVSLVLGVVIGVLAVTMRP